MICSSSVFNKENDDYEPCTNQATMEVYYKGNGGESVFECDECVDPAIGIDASRRIGALMFDVSRDIFGEAIIGPLSDIIGDDDQGGLGSRVSMMTYQSDSGGLLAIAVYFSSPGSKVDARYDLAPSVLDKILD